MYNLFLHPLAAIPGPVWWRASRLRFVYSLVSGALVSDVRRLHRRYGDVVRTAPDEVSFALEPAWRDVFSSQGGRTPLPKNATFFKTGPGQCDNMFMTADRHANARMRQLVMPGFTDRAVAEHEGMIQAQAQLMVDKLLGRSRSQGDDGQGAVVNIFEWLHWFAFDVVGHLALGEPFGCLDRAGDDPWFSAILNSTKGSATGPPPPPPAWPRSHGDHPSPTPSLVCVCVCVCVCADTGQRLSLRRRPGISRGSMLS